MPICRVTSGKADVFRTHNHVPKKSTAVLLLPPSSARSFKPQLAMTTFRELALVELQLVRLIASLVVSHLSQVRPLRSARWCSEPPFGCRWRDTLHKIPKHDQQETSAATSAIIPHLIPWEEFSSNIHGEVTKHIC